MIQPFLYQSRFGLNISKVVSIYRYAGENLHHIQGQKTAKLDLGKTNLCHVQKGTVFIRAKSWRRQRATVHLTLVAAAGKGRQKMINRNHAVDDHESSERYCLYQSRFGLNISEVVSIYRYAGENLHHIQNQDIVSTETMNIGLLYLFFSSLQTLKATSVVWQFCTDALQTVRELSTISDATATRQSNWKKTGQNF